jgi:transcription elongation factor
MEEEIVFLLLQMAYPRHEIRSAFANGSARGWVYVEATMNNHLRRLLRLTPGILCNHCGICSQHIPFNEGLALLKMCRLKDPPELGKWVQVRRGTYKGDVGYVLSVAASEVHLLLIPRLAPDASHSKRKRSQPRITPKLFNHETDNATEPRIHENIYSVGNDRFEHGLIVRSYSFDAIMTGISTIPLESFILFRASGHPQLIKSKDTFPRPSEWYFQEGEEVYNTVEPIPSAWWEPTSYKSGFISKLRDDAAELDTEEGIVVVPWMAICKVVRIGDFVEVSGGLHKEQKGWVDEVELDNQVANVIRMVDEGKPISGHVEVR